MAQTEFFFRWLHVFFGIVWIGHLYFFNFVNIPFQGKMDDATKKLVNPHLMPRALWWFRMGAMVTFLSGLILFAMVFFYTPGAGWGANMLFHGAEGGLSDRARWIMWGMLLGSIMWFNVWFIIWPAQKGLLSGKIAGDAAGPVRARATMASRANTYLSAPMLACMLGTSHAGMSFSYVALVAVVILGAVVVKGTYAHAGFVGQSV